MEKNTVKRKQLRRKYKRRAAALACAAIMTGTLVSGISMSKAQAAEAPSNLPLIKTQQTTASPQPGQGWHQHKNSWPGSDENQALYKDGKIYYRSDTPRHEHAYYLNSPVDYVKDMASTYGFNASLDDFTLLTNSRHSALVEVRQHDTGKLYNVLLKRTYDREWTIVDVHAI